MAFRSRCVLIAHDRGSPAGAPNRPREQPPGLFRTRRGGGIGRWTGRRWIRWRIQRVRPARIRQVRPTDPARPAPRIRRITVDATGASRPTDPAGPGRRIPADGSRAPGPRIRRIPTDATRASRPPDRHVPADPTGASRPMDPADPGRRHRASRPADPAGPGRPNPARPSLQIRPSSDRPRGRTSPQRRRSPMCDAAGSGQWPEPATRPRRGTRYYYPRPKLAAPTVGIRTPPGAATRGESRSSPVGGQNWSGITHHRNSPRTSPPNSPRRPPNPAAAGRHPKRPGVTGSRNPSHTDGGHNQPRDPADAGTHRTPTAAATGRAHRWPRPRRAPPTAGPAGSQP
ncbi:hypothetical protein J2S44_005926 [Catenuloplanes niger]|uniref:Uncharacterized protein n=1 Tax=Catenuloplanes niger TaxID=587534 RepID=A0AAE4CTT5_9ACTN|nr:hypothetical protein [Catenuloplanes niger]